jgi:hypothetical protein
MSRCYPNDTGQSPCVQAKTKKPECEVPRLVLGSAELAWRSIAERLVWMDSGVEPIIELCQRRRGVGPGVDLRILASAFRCPAAISGQLYGETIRDMGRWEHVSAGRP